MARNHKRYKFTPRWHIEIELTATSFLHIGSGAVTTRDNITIEQEDGSRIPAEINECIKDGRPQPKPFLPGSTIKGKIRSWLAEEQRLLDPTRSRPLVRSLLGAAPGDDDQGCGGAAEFHNGICSRELTGNPVLPYWDQELQTCIETSTVISRVTGAVEAKKLYYTELVPPGVGFRTVITGALEENEIALLLAVISNGFAENSREPISLGSGEGNGYGRFRLESIRVGCLGRDEVCGWLKNGTESAAFTARRQLERDKVEALIEKGNQFLNVSSFSGRKTITIKVCFSGPFLVHDPSRQHEDDEEQPHRSLFDSDGFPRLPARSVRGALRSRAEKIIRTLGGNCCDPAKPCRPVYSMEEVQENLCPVCRLFGASGWKSRVSIRQVKFERADLAGNGTLEHRQDFVAIDRFHGGGRDKAKFAAAPLWRPVFIVTLDLPSDLVDWEKGLLALTLRDLREGDIFFGSGRSKGYGKLDTQATEIQGDGFLMRDSFVDSLRRICNAAASSCPRDPDRQTPQELPEQAVREEEPGEVASAGQPFHNPYHFIPIVRPDLTTWLAKERFGPGMHDSHAIYRETTPETGEPIWHGTIRCTLTTETPTFVGGIHHHGDEPARIEHYMENGSVALPATSLRGLLSSLAEAASNSSLRVLDNMLLSYRQPVGRDNLSAIGMVLMRENSYYLYPLALPTFDQRYGLDSAYRVMFPANTTAPLKVYLENAYLSGGMGDFLNDRQTWCPENPEIYYMPLPQLNLNNQFMLNEADHSLLKRKRTTNIDLIFGLRAKEIPVPAKEAKDGYVPGILRILGRAGREQDMPHTKKHELFIPVPKDFANNPTEFMKTVPVEKLFGIPDHVVNDFHNLADQRTEPQIKHPDRVEHENQWLPYSLKGCRRNSGLTGDEKRKLRLKQGDLVYFRPSNFARQVAEISFSSVWRRKVHRKVHQYFPPELRPFHRDREAISPAELLFGFVQQDEIMIDAGKEAKLAFAGKVVLSPATLKDDQQQVFMNEEIPLKILATPKPPSPSLYFKKRSAMSESVAKSELDNPDVVPQGRKQYLHSPPDQDDPQGVVRLNRYGQVNRSGKYPWETWYPRERRKQKVKIKPLIKGVAFSFQLDFENCTLWELGLLLYSLRPESEYRHKIGMAKPLGLGSVRIDVDEVLCIDRKKRYLTDSLWQDRFNTEPPGSVEEIRSVFRNTMEPEIRHAIELLGNPEEVRCPVHYPQVRDHDIEDRNFQWFVDNDRCWHEYLQPVTRATGQLPVLTRKEIQP